MKGLIYREFYLSRKPAAYMLLAYVLFTSMITLVLISTYVGNLAKGEDAAETRDYLYSQMYIYIGLIGFIGAVYGHNDLIEKDYKSKWQLYSYTLPVNEKKIIASKFIVRGSLLFDAISQSGIETVGDFRGSSGELGRLAQRLQTCDGGTCAAAGEVLIGVVAAAIALPAGVTALLDYPRLVPVLFAGAGALSALATTVQKVRDEIVA